jgi:hypothetical protein
MSSIIEYQALKPCRAGGQYREQGERFLMPELETTPPHLKKLAGVPQKSDVPLKSAVPTVTAETGATPADFGIGEPTPVHEAPNPGTGGIVNTMATGSAKKR